MMAPITLLLTLLLALVATGNAVWAYRLRGTLTDTRALLSNWALACLFIALALLSQLLPTDLATDLAVVRRMALNLGVYIGLPFIAAALVGLGRRRFWSAAGWGRLMLGLFAAFELSRQLGYGAEYTQLLGAVCVLASLYGVTGFARLTARKAGWLGSALLALGLLYAAPPTVLVSPDIDTFLLCSLQALLLFYLALRGELQQQSSAQS